MTYELSLTPKTAFLIALAARPDRSKPASKPPAGSYAHRKLREERNHPLDGRSQRSALLRARRARPQLPPHPDREGDPSTPRTCLPPKIICSLYQPASSGSGSAAKVSSRWKSPPSCTSNTRIWKACTPPFPLPSCCGRWWPSATCPTTTNDWKCCKSVRRRKGTDGSGGITPNYETAG